VVSSKLPLVTRLVARAGAANTKTAAAAKPMAIALRRLFARADGFLIVPFIQSP
jgi:hypothetical protein